MYQTTVNFKVKRWFHQNSNVLGMFLEDWIDNTSTEYSWHIDSWIGEQPDIISVEFVHTEDAIIMKLKGIPENFQQYLELQ